jgi:hypothetical protein
MFRAYHRTTLPAIMAALLFAQAGCNRGGQTAAAVEPQKALATLQAVLEDWKQGGSPQSWRDRSPEVVVQDWDWQAGAHLKEFNILGPGDARDANLFCQVRLTLERPGQSAVQQTVTYVVGTDPVLTVFRGLPQ